MNPAESTGGPSCLPSNSFRFAVAAADTSPDVHIVDGFGLLFLQTSLHHLGRRYEVELAHTESPQLRTGTHVMDADGADTGPPCEKLPPAPVHIVI